MASVVLICACLFAYDRTVIKRSGRLTANSIFVYLQTIMALGTISLLDHDERVDVLHQWIVMSTLLAYMAISALIVFSLPPTGEGSKAPAGLQRLGVPFWGAVGVSVLVTVLYFTQIGHSAFVQGIRAQVGGTEADVATLRLESYSGSSYFFPGYVNQFKNALMPALFVVAVAHWHREGVLPRRKLAMVLFGAVVLFGLLGTGQRGAFVLFSGVVVTFLYLFNRGRLPKVAVIGAAAVVAILIMSTVALGRTSGDLGTEASLADRVQVAAPELVDRILSTNQRSSVHGFRYIDTYTEVNNGQEWAESFAGVLPGHRGSDLVNRIFAYRYGSDRGSSPPSIWGSIYHNFGLLGIAIAPIFLAFVLVSISRLGTTPKSRNPFELVGISGVFVVAGFWVAGSPTFLLNNGIVVYGALWFIGAHVARANESVSSGSMDADSPEARGL